MHSVSKIIFTTIIMVTFFLGSCIPGKMITFDTLTPAEFTFPPDAKKALIFNSSYIPSVDTSSFNVLSKLDDPEEQYIVDTLIINNIFNGFFYVIDQSPVPALLNAEYAEQRTKDTIAFLQPLSNESTAYLMREFDADIIISLEYYGMNYNTFSYLYDFSEGRAHMSIDRALLWRIYDRGGLMKEKNMRDTISWIEYGENEEDAKKYLPSIASAIREAFWFAGEKFAMELSPSWKETNRAYYLLSDGGEDRSLDPVYLQEIIEDDKGIRSYKANFNMGIYYEKEGNPAKALSYMDAALMMRPGSVLAKSYRREIYKKIEEYKQLQEQLH